MRRGTAIVRGSKTSVGRLASAGSRRRSLAESRTAITEQARLLELFGLGQPIEALLTSIARFVERTEPSLLCSILLADLPAGVLRAGAAPSLPAAYSEAIAILPIQEGRCSCGTAAARRRTVIVSDIATSPLWKSRRTLALSHGLAACWSVPLLGDDGELLGTAAMYHRAARSPTRAEMGLIRIAAALAGLAIQRFRDQQRLRASEARHRELIDGCPDGIIAHVDGRILHVNAAARELLRVPAREPMEDWDLSRLKMRGARNDLLTLRAGVLVTTLRRADGTDVAVEAAARSTRIDARPATLLALRDISTRNSLQNQLLDAANREQQHLAFDLHDGLGQQLTGISLMLSSIRSRLVAIPEDLKADLDLVGELVSKSINDTRLLASGMSPVTVERAGVTGALQTLREKAETIYRLEASLCIEHWPEDLIDPYVANHIYRIVQEAVGNVARHAKARHVAIDARAEGTHLCITVSDDGTGMPELTEQAVGLGLRSMRYRAERIGGSVQFEPLSPRGTRMRLTCPLPRTMKHA